MQKIEDYQLSSEQFQDLVTKRAVATASPNEEDTNQKLLGVTDEVLEMYYRTARGFIEDQNWFDARDAFVFLTFLNPYIHDFWISLGVAEQSQGKFQPALVAYTMAECTDPTNPVALANSVQCACALGELGFAKYSLEKAINCCGDRSEFIDLKEKLMLIKVT